MNLSDHPTRTRGRKVLCALGMLLLFGLSSCSVSPPEPSERLRLPSTDLDSFFSHVRHEPLALFHSDASPTIDKLIKEFNQAVTIADQLAADQSGRRKGTAGEEYAASTAGTIVGLFERAFACSEQARVRRDDVSQLAARVIEKTGVIGVSDELPEGGDPLEWARRQESAGRLGILLYTRARSIPSDLRDEMLSARGSELTFPCPSR